MSDLTFSDAVVVGVDADRLYELVSDVTRMGEWSPQCRACWWDEGGGPSVGAYFTGRNDDGKRTWETRSRVVAAEPGREFAWVVNVRMGPVGIHCRAGRRGNAAHRVVGIPDRRHRGLPRAIRRARRGADRRPDAGGQGRHPGHPGGDQAHRRGRLSRGGLPIRLHS